MSAKWWSAIGLSVLVQLLLGGCATAVYPPAPAADGKVETPYLLGPGDTLNIVVWRNPELSMVVPVRPDGRISVPLAEDLQASGRTATELARDIEKGLAKYIQSPIVTVVVTGVGGPLGDQIRVVGEAAKPQALPYRENMTLLDVMIAVGGITDFAAGNRASIVRKNGATTQQLGVRLVDLVRRGDLSANVAMRPGDIVIIPQSFF